MMPVLSLGFDCTDRSQQGEALPDDTPEKVPDLARGARPPLAAGDSEAPGVPVVLSLAALVLRSGGSCMNTQHHLQSGNVAMPSMHCLDICCLPWPAWLLSASVWLNCSSAQ